MNLYYCYTLEIPGPKVTLSKRKSAFERLGKEALPAQNETEMLTSKIKITKVAKSAIQGSTTRSSTPVSKVGSLLRDC